MKTLAKIAIGCGVALVLGGAVATSLLVGGAWWAKGKLDQVTSHESRIDELKQKAAAAAPFSRPSDGVVQEPRLLKFLEIRKRMATLHEQHRPELERMQKGDKAGMRDAWNALGWINELRRAHAEAQADIGMGDDEYRFHVEQVYKSAWTAGLSSPDPTLKVPQANRELFKKHEAEIKTYALSGLEMFGL